MCAWQIDEHGNLIKRLSFAEMLPHHAVFILMIVMEWDNLRKCRSKFRTKYAKSLKPGAVLPTRETCIKLMRVIVALMSGKLHPVLREQKATLGEPFVGAQDDIWSMKNCRESYGCMRISLIIKWHGALVDVNPLIAFRVFQSASHTGAVIAVWKRARLAEWDLDAVKSVTLWTEDGAANNIKSSKILGATHRVCGPHNFQRAILFALGMAGKNSLNISAKELVGRMSKQASSFHSSGVTTKALQEAQTARGVKPTQVKSIDFANATRWTGIFRCAHKSRLLAPDVRIALTGDKDGFCGEDPAEIEEADETDGEKSESDNEEDGNDVESDAEQVKGQPLGCLPLLTPHLTPHPLPPPRTHTGDRQRGERQEVPARRALPPLQGRQARQPAGECAPLRPRVDDGHADRHRRRPRHCLPARARLPQHQLLLQAPAGIRRGGQGGVEGGARGGSRQYVPQVPHHLR